jgi:hypothetical protein
LYVAGALLRARADLASRLVKADPKRVAALATNVSLIAARLLRLREIFPKVGVKIAQGSVHVEGLVPFQIFRPRCPR